MALSKHLETITLEFGESYYPSGGQGPDAPPNVCDHCALGSHHLCTGVDCYRCPNKEDHERLPGIAMTMERVSGKTVGR